jgi:enoyl-CoA hydratase/carnithine racemase
MDSVDAGGETSIKFIVNKSVAYITLNRPHVLNALDPSMLEGIERGVERAVTDPEVCAIVIRGAAGRAFSVGVDLKYFYDNKIMANPTESLRFTSRIRDTLLQVEGSEIPTIAAIEGFALAGGLELALACDFILCTNDSRIGDHHANFDLMPGAGSTQRLPRRIGTQRALELLFTGRHVDGAEAVAIGLALRSVPAEELSESVEALLDGLRGKSRAGLAFMKTAMRRGTELPLREALDLERLLAQEYFSFHGDALAGLTSFNTPAPKADQA